MEITYIGAIIIPLSFMLLFTRSIYYILIFFLPFSATAVINIYRDAFSGSGIQVSLWLGSLFVSREIGRFLMRKLPLPRHTGYSFSLLFLFAFIVLLSLSMPVIISGRLLVHGPEWSLLYPVMIPLNLSLRHITLYLYLLHGVFLTVFFAVFNSVEELLKKSLLVYIVSGIFVGLWGLMQWLLYWFNLPYPDFIFNNSIHPAAAGYMEETYSLAELKRITSVCLEASYFSKFMLSIAPFLVFSIFSQKYIFSPKLDPICFLFIVSVIILGASTTSFIGLFLLVMFSLVTLFLLEIVKIRVLIVILTPIILLFLSFLYFPFFLEYFITNVIQKQESYSGIERMSSIIDSFQYFLQYPILGIGWGSSVSHDLIVKLLAHTGILGFGAFSLFIFYLCWRFLRIIRIFPPHTLEKDKIFLSGYFVSFLMVLSLETLTGFTFVLNHLWFIIGSFIGATSLLYQKYYDLLYQKLLEK
ncbi:MAG: hypothetical protein WHT07_07530 [Desulfobaccales bacterium]